MVNNEVVEVFENFSKTDPGFLFDAWIEKKVQLQPGTNDLLLIVQNEQGALKHQRKIEVKMSPALRKDHALIFAVEEYDSWENLVGPIRDAEKIARVLEEKGFDIEIVRNFTTFELLEKLEEYVVKEFQPQDQLFIYFAGHGRVDEATGEGFLVCRNSVNLQNANSTYIAYSVIKSIVNNIPAQHIFVLMDAVKGRGQLLTDAFEKVGELQSDSNALADEKTRIGILSGTTKYRQGPAYNTGSYLSKAFINYLRSSKQSGRPNWGELLQEFLQVNPTPIYVEFGDHGIDSGFNFKQADAEN